MTDAPAPARLRRRLGASSLSWLSRFSKIGLSLCGLYLVPSALLLFLALTTRDSKGAFVFTQLALAPFMIVTELLGLPAFIISRPWLNSLTFCYPITYVVLYEIGWVADRLVLRKRGQRQDRPGIAVNLAWVAAAVATIVLVSVTTSRMSALAQERAREKAREEARLDGIIYSRLDPSLERQKQQSEQLLWSYPRDPRIRYAHASLMYDTGQLPAAEDDLAAILGDPEAEADAPDTVPYARALLARIDVEQGKRDSALAVMAPACASQVGRSLVGDLHLCP